MTAIKINPTFRELIPPLCAEELAQLEANQLGFVGELFTDDDSQIVTLIPTPMGHHYWIWTKQSGSEGIEYYTKKPTALSRIPLDKWRGFEFRTRPMSPLWDYPPPFVKPCGGDLTNIYFVQSEMGGPVKIGHCVDPKSRLQQHQTGSPFILRIVRLLENVPRSMERELHQKYAEHRLHGEWFHERVLAL